MPGPLARAFVADQHDITRLNLAIENAIDGGILAFENTRRAVETQNALIDARRLHDAAILGEIAVKHGEAAVLRKGVFESADGARLAVEIELLEAPLLAEGNGGRHPAGRG